MSHKVHWLTVDDELVHLTVKGVGHLGQAVPGGTGCSAGGGGDPGYLMVHFGDDGEDAVDDLHGVVGGLLGGLDLGSLLSLLVPSGLSLLWTQSTSGGMGGRAVQ